MNRVHTGELIPTVFYRTTLNGHTATRLVDFSSHDCTSKNVLILKILLVLRARKTSIQSVLSSYASALPYQTRFMDTIRAVPNSVARANFDNL